MEMLKILTQKLSQQSLNEGQQIRPSKTDEDRDSGTESDEENAELEALERAVLEQQENQENQGSLSSNTLRSPQRCRSPSHSVIKKPLQLANEPASLLSGLHSDTHGIHTSPQGSSDFGRCSSLDYDPSSSAEFLRHSSEEELTGINCTFREKRTWSQANHCNSCEPYSSGSSDEEVKDLLCSTQPVLFSSSPPKGVHRFSKTLSPRVFLARVSPGCTSSVSPRKRHRQTLSNDVSDASTVIQRPCIDFEKMQASGTDFLFAPYPNLLVSGNRLTPLCPIALR